MPPEQWHDAEERHRERADRLTAGWRSRRRDHTPDAVEDFLYTYYPTVPSRLRRWHPGAGVVLEGAASARSTWRWYKATSTGDAIVDAAAYIEARNRSIGYIDHLLHSVRSRTPAFGCFGMHEWAMVYHEPPGRHRHPIALRLGEKETDCVVDRTPIVCTHCDAYRFFTPDARPLNAFLPTREHQAELDQPGCLHANMDVYKWAMKLGPLVPGELLLDAFDLARRIRIVDMRASPYDVAALGLPPIRVEVDAGKREYARLQREFSSEAQVLRARLIDAIECARGADRH